MLLTILYNYGIFYKVFKGNVKNGGFIMTVNETSKMSKSETGKWYDDNKLTNDKFCLEMEKIIRDIIESEKLHVHIVNGRVKKKDSFLKKYEDKRYSGINQMNDVVGIRVITLILEDVDKVCNLIKKAFDVVEEDDKTQKLKGNEVGYQSVHYVLKLNATRRELPENQHFVDKVFEIQIRTLLQHAWAEIEHDNGYKFAGKLPKEIEREFYLIAGTLELMDMEFQKLSNNLTEYKKNVSTNIKESKLEIEINSASLNEYLDEKFKGFNNVEKVFGNRNALIIQELKDFGINTIAKLNSIITDEFLNNYKNITNTNYSGLIRDVMIISNTDKYFNQVWNRNWEAFDYESYQFYKDCYKHINIDSICEKYNIGIQF